MPRGGVFVLSDIKAEKICIACPCGLARRYDRRKLLDRAGDRGMPSLLLDLAKREGCQITDVMRSGGRCQVYYGTLEGPFGAAFFLGE